MIAPGRPAGVVARPSFSSLAAAAFPAGPQVRDALGALGPLDSCLDAAWRLESHFNSFPTVPATVVDPLVQVRFDLYIAGHLSGLAPSGLLQL